MVNTLDFESKDPSSNLGGTLFLHVDSRFQVMSENPFFVGTPPWKNADFLGGRLRIPPKEEGFSLVHSSLPIVKDYRYQSLFFKRRQIDKFNF